MVSDLMQRWRSRGATIAACLLAVVTAGCPLPVRHGQTLSGPVYGVLRQSDGTPVPGTVFAIAPRAACVDATVRATTDSAGVFRLAASPTVPRITWVPPEALDQPEYTLCAGTADTLRPVYHGYGSWEGESLPVDSVSCLEWSWLARVHVTCSGMAEQGFVTRGEWTAAGGGDTTGTYRVIASTEERSGEEDAPHAFVQWVARVAPGPPDPVVDMIELPLGHARGRAHVAIEKGARRWCADVVTTRENDRHRQSAAFKFELGRPGAVRLIWTC